MANVIKIIMNGYRKKKAAKVIKPQKRLITQHHLYHGIFTVINSKV